MDVLVVVTVCVPVREGLIVWEGVLDGVLVLDAVIVGDAVCVTVLVQEGVCEAVLVSVFEGVPVILVVPVIV